MKPAMEGSGVNLIIDPSQYRTISRTFSKGKGKMVQLSPEEIMANREIEGEGIFSTLAKGAKSLAKSKIGKSLGKTAIDMAVKTAGASGYVPPSVAKALGKEAKKQVEGFGIFDTIKKGAKSLAKSKIGKSLGKTAIDMAVKTAGASGYVPPSVAKALGKEAKKQVEGFGMGCSHCGCSSMGGCGMYAGSGMSGMGQHTGSGLYAGASSRGMGVMGRGALMGVHNSRLPPALQSQNMSANFNFGTQLPPSLAQLK
ncbi:hypothetical protein HQ447_20960 [bacterium]|nr:hypothetical protein [bacterium]